MKERPLEPPEPKEKCYIFKCAISTTAKIVIWAENQDVAEERLNSKDYENYAIGSDFEIEEVLGCEVD